MVSIPYIGIRTGYRKILIYDLSIETGYQKVSIFDWYQSTNVQSNNMTICVLFEVLIPRFDT